MSLNWRKRAGGLGRGKAVRKFRVFCFCFHFLKLNFETLLLSQPLIILCFHIKRP